MNNELHHSLASYKAQVTRTICVPALVYNRRLRGKGGRDGGGVRERREASGGSSLIP